MLNISETTKKLLESEARKYPNFHTYATHFINDDGDSEDDKFFPKLLVWIRKATDDWPTDFKMDDETYLEFTSWGHNSRWMNVFWRYMINNIDHVIGVCIELAQKNGDVKIDYSELED